MSAPAPATPMKALPSNLALRAAPAVPAAAQNYEPLVKNVLRQRLLSRTFTYSAAFCWMLVVLASTARQGGVSRLGLVGVLVNPFLPRTLGLAFTIWAVGVLPVLVLRKLYLTATPTSASSPSSVYHAALSKSSTLRSLAVYLASASLLTAVHVITALIFEARAGSDPRLNVFVKSKKHPYYLNGRLLYLISSQLSLAAFYVLRNVMMDRLAVRWTGSMSSRAQNDVPSFMLGRILTVIISASLLTAIGTVAHIFLFGLARAVALPVIFQLPFVSRLLRPFLAHFLRGSFSLTLLTKHTGLIFRAFMLGLMTVSTWDFAESLFDTFVAEPVNVSQVTADPAVTLVSGTTSQDLYYKHFAYAELAQFAKDETNAGSTKRVALFTDQKYNPSLWSTLTRETLLVLGRDYQLLLRRGAPEAAAPPPAAPAQKLDAPPQIPKTPYITASVLKGKSASPLHSALETIASDGSVTVALASAAEAGASQVPELFRSVMPSQTAAVAETAGAAVETVKKGEQEILQLAALPGKWREQLQQELVARAPGVVRGGAAQLAHWWRRERVHKVVEAALPNRKLDGLAADALCSLVCASLAEDRYGVVQRDIPRILEALLSFLAAVEEYQSEIVAQHPLPSPEEMGQLSPKEAAEKQELALDLARAGDALSEVADPLKDGIVRIVRTFGDKLSAFKFPPRIARKLQGFVDYN
ncbi:nucleoporin protein Ndc1-Nup [Phanerochaete sordida]|uniref:Nucleoporin protein Ndc1-Nup n=1 Tax=Phanerochaete sordida TaxID=48140 RepID=A0A9P3LM98_9APHY|nr:nucleoporin protein Ndc1-Nup [Phanerochaete sordida]